MKKVLPVLLLLLSPAVLPAQSPASSRPKALVFTHVTVVDATGAPAQPDMTVVITGDRIMEIGKSGKVSVPTDAQVLDATDQYLIPGLWDMHVHTTFPLFLSLSVANGVTGVRDMGNRPEFINKLRKEVADGTLLGPRIIAAGPIVDGPRPIWPNISIPVANASQARKAVDDLKSRGQDFIKVYSGLSREAYFAIAEEAKRQGTPFAGHVPGSVSVVEASNAGQKSIEHLNGVALACSAREDYLRRETVMLGRSKLILETYSQHKAAALFALLAKNETWQVPTLTVARAISSLNDKNFTNDPRLKYVPAVLRERWDPKKDFRFQNWTEDDWTIQRRGYRRAIEIVGAMHRAGVPIMAGTDTTNPYVFPGFSLHDELALLVQAGLTPMQALQTATMNPARFLGMEKELGTVQQGKLADLILLAANPLENINNTKKINAVVVMGRLLDRRELDGLLAQAAATAGKK
jgi:imidazolonepropionase-like amidohydrolase